MIEKRQRERPVVVVLGTGGTIAGRGAPGGGDLDYTSGQVGVDELAAALALPAGVVLETEQIAQLDSKDMDFATWQRLAVRVGAQLARDEVAGVVVTHGTDTLEETAWFLHRVVDAEAKPVVLTGAMRPATSTGADGPRNLADAIALAAAPGGRGVLVAFAGRVHDARTVRKTHPTALDAFVSDADADLDARADTGAAARAIAPAGREDTAASGEDAAQGATRAETRALRTAVAARDPSTWPAVAIVASAAGADPRAVRALVDAGFDGLVVAATGNGTVHRLLEAELRAAIGRGVAVLVATRCLDGPIAATSDAGTTSAGFASAGGLTPPKARVELMLRLLARA